MAKRRVKKPRNQPAAGNAAQAPANGQAASPTYVQMSATAVRAGTLLVTRDLLAKLMGVHADTITEYARGDMPVVTRGGRGKESAYDALACLAWQRQQMGKNAKENAQTRLFNANADAAELKLKSQLGEMVSKAEVIRQGKAYTKGWVAKLSSLPRLLVHAGHITSDREAEIGAMLNTLRTEIARWQTISDTSEAEGPEASR